MELGRTLANLLIHKREIAYQNTLPSIQAVDNRYDVLTQYELGTFASKDAPLRTRKQIYSQWQIMQTDPQIADHAAGRRSLPATLISQPVSFSTSR